MSLKDENIQPVSRFGFRFNPSKCFTDKKRNKDLTSQHDSKVCPEVKATAELGLNNHLSKQKVLVCKDGSINHEANKVSHLSEPCFDKHFATSSDNDSIMKSNSLSSASENISYSGITKQKGIKSSRVQALEVNDLVTSRRSRSRDICRNLKNLSEYKNDHGIGLTKSRSKSREYGLKLGDGKQLRVGVTKASAREKCSSQDLEVTFKRKDKNPLIVGINSNLREQLGNSLIDQASLGADLCFLRRKLMELRDVLYVATSNVDDVAFSSLREENYTLKEENSQLKEKVKNLESLLNLKLKHMDEMSDKFAAMKYLPVSINEGIETPHDSSLNSSSQNLLKNSSKNEDSHELFDLNDNILHKSSLPQEPSCDNHLLDVPQHDTYFSQVPDSGAKLETKIKCPRQLPFRSSFKKTAPKIDWKSSLVKDFASPSTECQNKTAFKLHTNVLRDKHKFSKI